MSESKSLVAPTSKAARIIRQEIQKIPGRHKVLRGNVMMIKCVFHSDATPSLMLNVENGERYPIGYFYCLGCGEKGNWNKFAAKLGLKTIDEKLDTKVDKAMQHKFEDIRSELLPSAHSTGVKFESLTHSMKIGLTMPVQESWRKIKRSLLLKLGTVVGFDAVEEDEALVLPVTVNEVIVGAVKARMRKEKGRLSYVTSPGHWVRDVGLFPFDFAVAMAIKKKMALVIVEGPRDALRLLQEGIPAVAILGSQNWSKHKRDIVLESGVKGVILAMDSDKAGTVARKKINSQLKQLIWTRVLNLSDIAEELGKKKVDPMTLPQEWIDILYDECKANRKKKTKRPRAD